MPHLCCMRPHTQIASLCKLVPCLPCIWILETLHQGRLTYWYCTGASLPNVSMRVCSSSIYQGIMLVHVQLCQCAKDTISLPFLIALTGFVVVCAALSTHAGRNQRSLPDKRARRKPGWLDNTVDPRQAAQLALQQAAADVSLDAASCVTVPAIHLCLASPATAAVLYCCCCSPAALLLICYYAAATWV